ncbi:TetR/AcrR family transcriptional regulator [Leptotrichia sp. OH3620_COT-345]|uniref:TetR/AcrR family transcriptional regulator n=1 Tax=Leptotrichia sp. OH3620_COT-345 TaxID=2491048 RepID=UPI000F6460A9|nr:TetR/AcrR family transcriptional regulator [Leptotrichia sp. OH3620_COT-345]RRD38959.1 TetR/AcrR family transcriptional regulator [Leptotrichia sp. OH3620_COT-345]
MPKVKFTKKDIIKATYEIMKYEGIKNISARKIAGKFKGSTAPIYANFSTIEELKEEIVKLAEDKLNEYLSKVYSEKGNSERKILNNAIGFIVFAREEKELYRAIFLDGSKGFKALFDETITRLLSKEELLKSFPQLPEEEAKMSVMRLWYFLYGYGTLVCTNAITDQTNEVIEDRILDIAKHFKALHGLD